MNETDVRKCIKNGHAWSSCGDNPEPTPTRDYTRGQLATYEGLHATKHEAKEAIDASKIAKPTETPSQEGVPEGWRSLPLNTVMERGDLATSSNPDMSLALTGLSLSNDAKGGWVEIQTLSGERADLNDVSALLRRITETPAERDARIKALVDGYKAKGGPITKEQLTDEVVEYLNRKGRFYYSVDGTIGNDYTGNFDEWDGGPYYWNKSDAEHAKWLADMQSQTTPITPEQAKMLREGDKVWFVPMHNTYPEPYEYTVADSTNKDYLGSSKNYYFTCDAAQAALDEAKAEAEPLEWCERGHGEHPWPSDQWTWCKTVGLQEPATGVDIRDQSDQWMKEDSVRKSWDPYTFVGKISFGDRILRVRYRNPLWLANHGHKGMIYNNNTNRWEPESVESHETPVGETQAKEVVTDDTRCKICMGVIGAIHAAACSAGADMLDEQDEKRLHELFDRQEKETVAKSDEQDPEPVKWLERKSDEHVQKGDDITWNRSVGINDACAFQHAHDGWTPLTSDPDKFPEPVGYEYTGLTLRSRYLTPEWKAWKARQDAKASNKEPVEPVEVTPTDAPDVAKSSNKPTTVRGWLETISDSVIREAALRQLKAQAASNQASSLPMALSSAFDWRWADEGFDFWNTCRSASIGEKSWPAYPFKDRQEADGQTQVEIDKAACKPVGNKYHRTIHGVTGGSLVVDVYNVLDAFGVTCPACQHAIKKLLCAGLRNKGSRLQDLTEAKRSVERAVELEQQRNEGAK